MPPRTTRPHRITIAADWRGEPLPADERAWVELGLGASGLEIRVDAPFAGDPPPPGPVASTDRLWEHEVVELFVVEEASRRDPSSARYLEVEMSPHGHHLVLRLLGIRRVVRTITTVDYRAHIDAGRWQGTMRLERGALPPRPWAVNAYRIHGVGDQRRYQAAHPVPGDRPDFHRLLDFPHLE